MTHELGSLRLRAFGLLAAMFAVGAVAGAGISRLAAPRPLHLGPPGMDLLGQLALSAEQRTKADKIFERHRPELDAILRETMPRVRQVQETIDREVRDLLDPGQARRFDELRANRPPFPPMGAGQPPPPMGPPPPPPR